MNPMRAALRRVALPLLLKRPALGIRLAGVLGRGMQALDGPTPAEIPGSLAALAPRAHLAREVSATRFRNMASHLIVSHRGLRGLAPLLRVTGAELLDSAAIVAIVHHGARHAVTTAVAARGRSMLVLRQRPSEVLARELPVFATFEQPARRAMALKLATDTLRRGVPVLMTVDDHRGYKAQVLGQPYSLGNGAHTLVRLTNAPLVLARSRYFSDGTMGLALERVHETTPEGVKRVIANFVEELLRELPGQTWKAHLRFMS